MSREQALTGAKVGDETPTVHVLCGMYCQFKADCHDDLAVRNVPMPRHLTHPLVTANAR